MVEVGFWLDLVRSTEYRVDICLTCLQFIVLLVRVVSLVFEGQRSPTRCIYTHTQQSATLVSLKASAHTLYEAIIDLCVCPQAYQYYTIIFWGFGVKGAD